MSNISIFQIARDLNGPPGLTHPLLKENYDWVDNLLKEKYYLYGLTEQNINDYEDSGLLNEKWAWVDKRLEDIYKFEESIENNEVNILPLRLTPITWVNYKSYNEDKSLEEEYVNQLKRKYSDSESSFNYLKKNKNMYYDEEYEFKSVSSLDLQSDINYSYQDYFESCESEYEINSLDNWENDSIYEIDSP